MDFKKKYAVSLKDLVFLLLLATLAGSVLTVTVPIIIYTIAIGFIFYVGYEIYARIKKGELP